MTLASTPASASTATVVGRTLRSWVLPLGIFFGAIIVWDLLTRVLGLPQFILPAPSRIAEAWITYLPELWSSATYTLVEILMGMAIGGVAGIGAGVLVARWAGVRESILPVAIGISAIPIIAVAPLFNNWFGLDNQLSKAMVAAVLVFFPVMINTARGLMHVEPAALELMRSMAATDSQVFREVRSHSAMPFVFTALKVGTTLATIGAIIGEYFGGAVHRALRGLSQPRALMGGDRLRLCHRHHPLSPGRHRRTAGHALALVVPDARRGALGVAERGASVRSSAWPRGSLDFAAMGRHPG